MTLQSVLPSFLSTDKWVHPREVLKSFPVAAAKPFSHLPFFIQKRVASLLLTKLFEEALKEGDLDCLQGKWLTIDVRDIGLTLQFSCGPKRELLIRHAGACDVSIRGNLKSFVFLAARSEDPDTLFFQRDLVIEGDTDLGLEIKNLLDAIELDALPPELMFMVRSGAVYMETFCS